MTIGRTHLLRGAAILVLAGGAMLAGPAVLHQNVHAGTAHQTVIPPRVYVTIPGVSGEVQTSITPTPSFAADSLSLGTNNPASISSSSSGAGAGKAQFSEITISKRLDKTTPSLFHAMVTGTHFRSMTIDFYKSGGPPQPYLTYKFQYIFVTSLQEAASDGIPSESLSMAYGSIVMTYRPTNTDGTYGLPVSESWNQVTNTSDPNVPGN